MLLIFTDLDGTLLNSDDYGYDAALPVLKQLQYLKIPVIPVTSKTRTEVEVLREQIGLTDSFIVENGSAVFIPISEQHLASSQTQHQEDYYLMQLGFNYTEARQGLQKVAEALNQPLKGFADLSEADIHQLTGLPPEDVKQAKSREFSEPFVTPKNFTSLEIEQTVNKLGFQVVVGDRFSHLISREAGKGKAVQWLVQQYHNCQPEAKIMTVGLGNSPNDLAMLEVVEIPVIIPGHKGPHPGLENRGWEVATASGCQGWANAVIEICNSFKINLS
ncbi:mannosyl-3-phosphoglycerate phosphatase [Lyngbya sp. PCC 8106]|uniref:HAD-IIB family hydrolase n=1 Tax=Lyngbya sp. (strain PCC 8106) TaxID=313612 RepID=UPI0000EA9A59|nr:HAD-IIB family hydrolase [Lyngbya sp. PCC 8106]EAW34073.1 HAD-superfamily hydrolase subfamily IIB:HAD-superfamily hydrolase YedP [Lyngbya sp. PCC 8106]